MSSLSQVQVERVERISPHSNADSVELLELSNGFTVIDKIGTFKLGEKVAYVPVDMKYDGPTPEKYDFLPKGRVKGRKIRGIVSCGLPLKLEDQSLELSTDVSEAYGFIPYEAPEPSRPGASLGRGKELRAPIQISKYDIESIRKYHKVFSPEIVVTEKIHGAWGGFLYHQPVEGDEAKFYCKSKNRWLDHDGESAWSKAATIYGLEEKLKNIPNMLVCGEIYGQVQDLKYGASPGEIFFAVFDIYSVGWGRFLDYDHVVNICDTYELPRVPEVYRGPWLSLEHIKKLGERNTLAGKDPTQIAEGVVVKYTKELTHPQLGRVILKYPSELYLTRK
jgi:RNA ligase (TIGR02306 family)